MVNLELFYFFIQAKLRKGSEVYMDNLLTSFPLLDKLSEMGIAGTGTVRQNRLHRVPIIDKKEVEKKVVPRGFSQTVFRNDQVKTCTITYTICLYIPICLYFLIYLFFYNMYLPTYLPGYLPYYLPTFLWFHRSWLHGKITRPSTWRATSMGQPTG
jgi:hypothetical protein